MRDSFQMYILLVVFYDASRALAAADAQCCQAVFRLLFFEAVEQGNEDTSTGCSDRMTEGNSTAVDVDLRHIEAQFLAAVCSLCSKCFVCFHEVHVCACEACFFQSFTRRRNRACTHDSGINACRGIALNRSERFDTQFFSFVSGHNNECGRTVVNTRSIAGRNRAAVAFESGF